MTAMRTVVNNPFVPGSDQVPGVWAGRDAELADWRVVRDRRQAGVYEPGRTVLGEFGLGKSVLVNRIAAEAEADGHWVTRPVRLVRGVDPTALVAASVRQIAARHDLDAALGQGAQGLLGRLEEVTLPVIGGGVKLRARPAPVPHLVLHEALVELGRLARAQSPDRLVVLRIDEVQNATSPAALSALMTAIGDALSEEVEAADGSGQLHQLVLPLVIYLSGLPEFAQLAGRAGVSFTRRFRTFHLEPLDASALRAALTPFVTSGWPLLTEDGPAAVFMEPSAVERIVDRCLGDPFLFQLAGAAAWDSGSGPVITGDDADRGWSLSRREIGHYLDRRLDGLTDLQLAYLRTAAALAPEERTAARIAAALGRSDSAALGSTAQALAESRGLIRRSRGQVTFRSPAVEAYLAGGP